MRVIGGSLRGRPLVGPAGPGTRATADKVREAIFDMLASMRLPGGQPVLEGQAVLDLYAGTGAFGIEALSRGASSAVFVERDAKAAAVLRENLSRLGLSRLGLANRDPANRDPALGRAKLVMADALDYLEASPGFAVAFCDPPYDFDRWQVLLGRLRAAIAVMETNRPVVVPDGWVVVRQKRYGGTLVTMAESDPAGSGDPVGTKDRAGTEDRAGTGYPAGAGDRGGTKDRAGTGRSSDFGGLP